MHSGSIKMLAFGSGNPQARDRTYDGARIGSKNADGLPQQAIDLQGQSMLAAMTALSARAVGERLEAVVTLEELAGDG